ncbi:MAG: HlyD family efflux transporter periplasmic adaptor subunit [Elusimicrobia bacterium]|nr:HlyD family efflux transporter periplasmic adaptor subunit [Elusimicrobiota bacterium]
MRTKVIAFILIAAAGSAVFVFQRKKLNGRDQLRTVAVESGPIVEAVEATGAVEPLNRVEVRSPIAGRIDQLLVEEGDKVAAGQIVGWMSSTDRVAVLDAAQAKGKDEFARWQDAYKPTPIVAPIAGDVILRNVVVGEQVGSSAIIYAVSDRLIVSASVDEADIGRVKNGMPADITLDSFPDKTVGGKVFRVLFEGKNVSNVITYMVKISPDRVPANFRSQMTANIKLILRRKAGAVLLATSAIKENRDGEKTVLVPGPDGKPSRQAVKVGIESGEMTEILAGLKPGDQVFLQSKRYSPQAGPATSLLSLGRRPGGAQPGQTQPAGGARRNRKAAAPGS